MDRTIISYKYYADKSVVHKTILKMKISYIIWQGGKDYIELFA